MDPQEPPSLVPLKEYIVLVDNRNEKRLLRICDNKNFKWRKIPISLSEVGKYPYFTALEVGNHLLTPLADLGVEDEEPVSPSAGDGNRDIFTLDQPQKLAAETIQEMKKTMRPQQLISQIATNNQQFSKRTIYSKEKYLRDKRKKYQFHIHAQPATLDSLHSFYYSDDPRSVGHIRWDALALLLLYGGPYKRVLLAEKTKGILLGSLLLKQAPHVMVVSDELKSLKNFPILEQLNIKKPYGNVEFTNWAEAIAKGVPHFDNLVVLGNYDFADVVDKCTPILQKGALLTFYCLSSECLVEAEPVLKKLGYLSIRLFDTFSRTYQVLKNRTHPMVGMDSCSGYLLTAIRV